MGLTPEIEAILDSLAESCCESLSAGGSLDMVKCDELICSLATNGWEQHKPAKPLWVIIKDRAVRNHPEPAMHRGAALEKLARKIESNYQLKTFGTNVPDSDNASS